MPRHNKKIEKSKDFSGSIKRVLKSLKKWYLPLIIALILAMISAVISLFTPNKLSELTDYITEGLKPRITEQKITQIMANPKISNEDKIKASNLFKNTNKKNKTEMIKTIDKLPKSIYKEIEPVMDKKSINQIALLLAILYFISAFFNYIQQIIMSVVTNDYAKQLRTKITNKINDLPLKYFDNHETGDILSRITNDVDSLAQNMNQSFSNLITSITLFLGSILMMFITNWIMAITAIISSLIGFIFMAIVLSKSQKYFIERQKRLGDLNSYIEEMYSGHNVITTYNAVEITNKQFDKLNGKLYNCSRKSEFLSGMMHSMMIFVGNLGYVAVCIVGALLTIKGNITFGVIVAFMIYVKLFTNPLSQIAQSMTSLQTVAASAERVFEFLNQASQPKENITKHLDKNKVKGNIEFKNVKFGYNDKLVIKNFSAKVKQGQKVAIVGPTGAGKTTIVNLLMKFYEINDGDILIDNISIKDLSRENIRKLFIMVLQDTWLFDGTIKENIKFNHKNVTDKQIWEACKTVGLDHFIKTLPGTINAQVGDNESISQGQKQLITIARGMIENAPFLILDEATSNVDTRTEELVQKAMDKLTEGRTSFIIAHRLSTIKNADLILVMQEGNIVDFGNHDQLMKKKGFYAELYNSQFKL